ncbi:hypothetical protein CB1_000149003 [Camelus ferus]|nr:hypothetical protein CB1_000149003 [Camelus ferus]
MACELPALIRNGFKMTSKRCQPRGRLLRAALPHVRKEVPYFWLEATRADWTSPVELLLVHGQPDPVGPSLEIFMVLCFGLLAFPAVFQK